MVSPAVGVVLCTGIAVGMMLPAVLVISAWCPFGCVQTFDAHTPWYDGSQRVGPVLLHPSEPGGLPMVCLKVVLGVAMDCRNLKCPNAGPVGIGECFL